MAEHATDPRTRRRRLVDIAGAAVTALLAFAAVPAVLVTVVGNPLGGGLGHSWAPGPRGAMCALALAAWLAWAVCCTQLVRAVLVHVRNGGVRLSARASLVDWVAARIAVGVLAVTTVGVPLAVSGAAGAVAVPGHRGGDAVMAPGAPGAIAVPKAREVAAVVIGNGPTVDVRSADTLWDVAAAALGDGAEWPVLAAHNLGRAVGHGARFVDPNHLHAGWRLHLPQESEREAQGATRRGSDLNGAAGTAGRTVSTRHGEDRRLPELVALGLGSLTCAALARRAGRRRHRQLFTGTTPAAATLSDAGTDAATLLGRFTDLPALTAFEVANCMLARELRPRGRPGHPVVRAACVSPEGVTFWFASPQPQPPPGRFAAAADGMAWHVDHGDLDDAEPSLPHASLVLPIGDDEDGTWLVGLEAGQVLPLLGESAPGLRRALELAVGAWRWSDTIVASTDPHHPAFGVTASALDAELDPHLLFFGDPRALPAGATPRVAVVTTEHVAATDMTVLVDRQGATLHPMGRVVRPQHLSAEMAGAIAEVVGTPEPGGTEPDGRPLASTTGRGADTLTPTGAVDPTGALAPGTVEVRLLTMTPRLDGLREPLPANRARRAVELVAYLALHHPDVVTGDRLRTRVLGSSDADAAAKTLFNTAYAARRAMGPDQQGGPLFPAGSRTGHYCVSPEVSADVVRALVLAEAGHAQDDPELAIATFRAALDLVEGEPLANVLAGYTWWEAEGHGGRVAAALVGAACTMASLGADAGLYDLARWGLDRARLVAPYSEALSRAAMELAAAEGDADRLRLEWQACQRMVDALDPGSAPSPRTETLYGQLARRVLVAAGGPDAQSGDTASGT